MTNSKYEMITCSGHQLLEVASAFQKCVRRGYETQALYWMVEIYESGYDEYLWKRIRIISSEDVGLANPNIPANIQGLYAGYIQLKKKKDERIRPERLFLTHAVLMLCRSKKSRVVDHALIYHWRTHDNNPQPIPGFAHDKHTQKGRSAGYGWKHFFEESIQLANMAIVDGEEDYRQKAMMSTEFPEKRNGKPENLKERQKRIFD